MALCSRWPLWFVPLTAMVRPIATIRRTQQVALWQAWLIHLVGLGLCVAAAELLTADILLFEFSDLSKINPRMFSAEEVVALIAGMIGLEVAFVLTGWMLMAWSAWPHEKGAASFARSLKRVWLLTSLGASVIAAGILIGVLAEALSLDDFLFRGFLVMLASTMLWAITIVIALWALAVGRCQQSCRWPGQCEGCGYPLIGLNMTHACPECGQAVADSLGPDVRPGCASDRHPQRGWLRTSYQALFQPRRLGQSLQVMTLTSGHSCTLAINMALLWLVGPVSMLIYAIFTLAAGRRLFGEIRFVLFSGMAIGFYLLMLGLVCVFTTSSLIGSILSRAAGRNLLPLATQAASYVSVWLALWAMVMMVAMGVFILFVQFYFVHHNLPNWFLNLSIAGSIAWPIVGLVVWLGLVWRITWAGRYANR